MVLIILSHDAVVALNSVDKIPQSNHSKEFCRVVSCRSAVYFTPVLTEKCLLFVEGNMGSAPPGSLLSWVLWFKRVNYPPFFFVLVYVFRVCMIKENVRLAIS